MPATAPVTARRSRAIDGAVPVAGMARSYNKPAHLGMRSSSIRVPESTRCVPVSATQSNRPARVQGPPGHAAHCPPILLWIAGARTDPGQRKPP